LKERFSDNEAAPTTPVELHEWRGEDWSAVSAQAAKERDGEGMQACEDVVHVNEKRGLFILCDGMGGHADGRQAAHVVAQSIDDYFETLDWDLDDHEIAELLPTSMIAAIRHAQTQLWNAWDTKKTDTEGQEASRGDMDTTATVVLLRKLSNGNAIAIIGQVGNTRAYRIRQNRDVDQLTEDQDIMATFDGARLVLGTSSASFPELNERRAAVRRELDEATDKKTLSEEARMLYKYRNITMSVGHKKMTVAVDVCPFPDGGSIALVSDGVTENLGNKRTQDALSMVGISGAGEAAAGIVREAKEAACARPKKRLTVHDDDVSALVISQTP
jgi:serine/threonine protein phosphatase PrpC